MANTLKNIRENIAASQMARLKKEYEPLRKIDMSKHKGQVEKTTAMLSKLKIGTLIDLYKENIPWISDIAKSLVKKDKRFAHHVEEVEESIMGLNKWSAEYKAGKAAAKKGIKYDDNPHPPGVKRLNWSTGHNDFRADALRKAGKPNYGARGQFEELEEGTWHIAKDMTQLKKAMRRPMRAGDKIDGGDEYSRNMDMLSFISNFIGDDELSDRIYYLRPRDDTRPLIRKAMKRLGIKEEVQLDEFTISDIKQMAKKKWIAEPTSDQMKELQKINHKNNGNITRKDLNDVGVATLGIASEADLTKTQIKMVHDKADELPKNDFIKRYGKDGDSVRYATATNIVKKKLGIEEETSPEVADVLKKFVTANPLRFHGGPGLQGGKNKRDFIELQKLALSDMDKFRKKYNDMKAKRNEDNYNQKAVRDALTKAGLSKHLTDEHKIEGDETMNESYKDKFNAAMKKFGINSLDDLKTDADKKKFFNHVDSTHTADHEEVTEAKQTQEGGPGSGPQFKSATIKKAYGILNDPRYKGGNYSGAAKAIEKIAKGLSDHPDVKNALKRANEDFKLKDSDVEKLKKGVKELPPINLPLKFGKPEKVGVKSSYGEDHDCDNEHPGVSHESWKSKEKNEMKQESKKYHDTKPGSIQDTIAQMQVNETKSVTIRVKELSALIETYLARGGVSHNLSPVIAEEKLSEVLPLQAVREFIDTYNRHFLTNYKAEEFVVKDRLNETQTQEGGPPKDGGPGSGAHNHDNASSGPTKSSWKPLSKNHSAARMTVSKDKAEKIKSWLADHGETYPVAIDDNGSGQITIDDDGEDGSSYEAGKAIAKKFGVKVVGD